MSIPTPPYDPEMGAFLDAIPGPKDLTIDFVPALRQAPPSQETAESVLKGEPYTHEERQIRSTNGPVTLSFFYPQDSQTTSRLPALLYTHGGGMICGNRFTFCKDALAHAKPSGAVVVSVEYRLAPEHPYPAAIDDCWAALRYVGEHAAELRIDADRLMLFGSSAGANLSAALTMLARDRKGPKIIGQLLDCPMLDDRNATNSSRQVSGHGTWTRGSNIMAWGAYLGPDAGKDTNNPYAVPARCSDFSSLPPAFITVGSTELFRDEAVEYAQKLWAAGVQCELHVWPGTFHCFDSLMPKHALSVASMEAKANWTKRLLEKKIQPKL